MTSNKIRTIVALVSAGVAGLGLAACGSSDDDGGTTDAASTKDGAVKVALVASGPRNDGGFMQAAFKAMSRATTDAGNLQKTSEVDNVTDPQKQINTLREVAKDNDVVVAAGAVLNQAVEAVAPKYPKTHFLLMAATTKSAHDNVTAIMPQPGLVATVAGAALAEHSRSHKLGLVAGPEVPATTAWGAGMKQGAALVENGTQVSETYTGSYTDVGKAKQAAQAQIANGVDVLLGDLDSGIAGLYQAVKASGKKVDVVQVFGLDCKADASVLGSGIVNWEQIQYDAISGFAAGELEPGAVFYGLKNPKALRFEACPGKLDDAAQERADDVAKQVADGTLTPAKGVTETKPPYPVVQR